ncbi:MAG TPA: SDR family NAD(P)-dependent oxidoreductase, partial [Chryseosolibacter sp.]|nr:SDR family NAD(P)-dependent oxidoreductase [Chryseosolibacter sp.]
MFDLGKKIAVITGAGSGIGKAIADVFAQQRAMVYLLDLNKETLEESKNQIVSKGGKAVALACDVSDQVEVTNV